MARHKLWNKDEEKTVTTTTGKTYKMSQVGTKNYTVNQQKAAENKAAMAKAEQVHKQAQAKAQQQQKAQQKAQIKTTAADRVKKSLLSMPEMTDYTRESVQPDKYDTTPGTLPKIKNVLRRADNAGASILAKQLGSREAAIKTAAAGVKSKATSLLGGNESDRYKRQMSALSSKYGVRAATMPEYKLAQLNYNNALAKEKIKSRQAILKATKSADDYKKFRNAALDGLTGGKRTAANFLMGAGDMGADIALLGATGAVGGAAAMGLGAMGDKARQVALKGGTTDDAVKAGLLSGGVSAAVNYAVPKALGKVGALAPKALPTYRNSILAGEDLIRNGNSGYISGLKGLNSELAKTVLSNAAKEGVHGSAFGVANTLGQGAANALLGEQTGITPGSLAREAGTGFIMGAGIGGIRGGIGAYGASRGNKAYAEGFADEYNKHYDELRGDLRKGLLDRQVQQTPLMLGTTKGTLGEKIVNDAKNMPLLIGTTKPKFEPDFYANGNGSIFSADAEGMAAYENSHNIPRTPLLEGDITNPNVDFVVGSAGTVKTNNATDYANAVNQFNNKTETERQAARNLYANRERMATEYGLPNNLGEGFVNPTEPIVADTDPRSTIKYYSDGKGQVTLFDMPYEGIEEPSGHYPIYNGRQLLRSDRTPDYASSKGTKEEFSRRNIIDNRKNIINNRPPENEPTANEPYPVYDGKQPLVGGKTLGGKINKAWAKINAERNTTPGKLPTGTAPKTENITANSKADTMADTTPGKLPKSKIKSEPQPTEAYNTRRNRQAGKDYSEFKASDWKGLSREEVNTKIRECNNNIKALEKETTTPTMNPFRNWNTKDEIDYQKEKRDSLFMYRDSLGKKATGTKQRNTTPGELPTYGKGTVGAAEAKAANEPQIEMPESARKAVDKINEEINNAPPIKTADNNGQNLGIVADLSLSKEGNRILNNLRNSYQATVSGQAPLERMERNINKVIKNMNKKGANMKEIQLNATTQLDRQSGGVVDYILEKHLTDITGEQVAKESFQDIVKEVPEGNRKLFGTYLQELHNIDRQAQGKPVNAHTAEESRKIVSDLETQHPEFKKYEEDYHKYFKTFGQAWLVDTGMTTQENFDKMWDMYSKYTPTFRVDKNSTPGGVFGKNLHTPNAIGKAKGSTEEIMPFEEATATKIQNIVKSSIRNSLYKEIAKAIDVDPELMAQMGAVRAETDKASLKDLQSLLDDSVNDTLKQLENGDFSITYFDGGKKQTLHVSKNAFEAIRLLDNSTGLESDLSKAMVAGIAKAMSPVKASITGSNPVFAVANAFRDLQSYLIYGTGGPIRKTTGYVHALFDIITRNESDGYHALGSSRSGFYNNDEGMSRAIKNNATFKEKNLGGKAKNIATTAPRLINRINEVIEEAPRRAEYKNSLKKYGNTPEGRLKAMYNAAEVTTNFSRSGPVTKVLNSGTLYLNPAVQGTDRLARGLKNEPVKVVGNGLLYITLPMLITKFWNKENPHYQELDQRTKDAYICLPNEYGEHDKDGNATTFIKLPKAEGIGFLFNTTLDHLMDYAETGDTKSFDGLGNAAATNLLPTNPATGNIFASTPFALKSNKDFANRNIVSPTFIQNNVPPKYQYTATTSGVARTIANVANQIPGLKNTETLTSPQRVDYLLNQTGIVGDEMQAATLPKNIGRNTKETAKNTAYNMAINPFKQRFKGDPTFSNRYTDELYNSLDEAKRQKSEQKYSGETEKNGKTSADFAVTYYNNATDIISDLRQNEQEILTKPGSYKSKEKAISENRKKMNAVAKTAMDNVDSMSKDVQKELDIIKKSSVSQEAKEQAIDTTLKYYSSKSKEKMDSNYSTDDYKKIEELKKSENMSTANAILFRQTLNNMKNSDDKRNYIMSSNVSDEYKLEQISSKAKDTWKNNSGKLKENGISNVSSYSKAYSIVWNNKKGSNRESRVGKLQTELGISYDKANKIYDLIRQK